MRAISLRDLPSSARRLSIRRHRAFRYMGTSSALAMLLLLAPSDFAAASQAKHRRSQAVTAQTAAAADATANLEMPPAVRYDTEPKAAPLPSSADSKIKTLGIEPTGIVDAIVAYRADRLDAGDLIAAKINDPLVRAALEWVALRNVPQSIDLARLQAFATVHPDWPARAWLRRQMEMTLIRVHDPVAIEAFFADRAPETADGKFALARALRKTGRMEDGTKLARAVFREGSLTPYLEGLIRTELGDALTKGDYKYRADRLLFQEHVRPALHYAAKAGSDVLKLAAARAAVINEHASDKAIAAVPEAWRTDPGLILAEVQKLRRADKLITAAQLLRNVTAGDAKRIDGDAWWTERRMLARRLLDAGKINAAYITCALHTPGSHESDIDAEFHAGWIALRFMHDTERATYHFWAASKLAETPTSTARIAYWQARTAEASSDPHTQATARSFYEKAAVHGSTYYGQLARQALGLSTELVRAPAAASGDKRIDAIRVIELLYAAGEKESAVALAAATAETATDPSQIAALAAVVVAQQDAHLSLTIGKIVAQRGLPIDSLAYPTFGIPSYRELPNSAPIPIVYSVARQESAFTSHAVSGAGAKGLMQMIVSTARRTAAKARIVFNAARLLHDAAFNAQLGAAHLGTLISEQKGSLILTFAAYNAGGGRVQEWIEAHGDPRKPGVDPIDWVEQIPFSETRNYVQRVMANVEMYTAIFADKAKTDMLARAAGEAKI